MMKPLPRPESFAMPLAAVIESAAASLLLANAAPIALELDVDFDLSSPVDPASLTGLLTHLMQQAIDEMPDGGDLTITACQTARGLEMEIADTGEAAESRRRTLPMITAALSADVSWQNCPQGGAAVTIVLPAKKAAAAGKRRAA